MLWLNSLYIYGFSTSIGTESCAVFPRNFFRCREIYVLLRIFILFTHKNNVNSYVVSVEKVKGNANFVILESIFMF